MPLTSIPGAKSIHIEHKILIIHKGGFYLDN